MKIYSLFTIFLFLLFTQGLFTNVAHANNVDVQMSQCDVKMQGTLGIQNDVITITQPSGDTVVISPEQDVSFNNNNVVLTTAQRTAVEQYYYNIKAAIPMGIEIAAQGLEMSNVAVNEVLSPLLGEDDQMVIKLNELLTGIANGLQNDIYDANGNLYIDSANTQANWFSPEWEEDFNLVLQETIEQNMGRLMIAIGTELLFGDGSFGLDTFNADALAERVGQKLGQHGNQLGEAVTTFCDIVKAADAAETQISTEVTELKTLDMIQFRQSSGN